MVYLLALILPFTGFAQEGIAKKARIIAQKISEQRDSLEREQKRQIRQLLDSIDTILEGGTALPPGGRSQLSCVARDNDNRAPWILVKFSRNGRERLRVGNFTFSSRQDCDKILRGAITHRGIDFFCKARDNDNRAPWALYRTERHQATLQRASDIDSATYSTLEACAQVVAAAQIRGRTVAFCKARDNDNRNPWIRVIYDPRDGSVTRGSRTFDNNACRG